MGGLWIFCQEITDDFAVTEHAWGFTGFQAGETELIISYALTQKTGLEWLSRYKLKGKAKLNISSKPILIFETLH